MSCGQHDPHPVNNMPAVYRCASCGMFAYKAKARTGLGTNEVLTPYKCFHKDCQEPVVIIFPIVKFRKRKQPSCQIHRKDKA